MDFGDCGFGIGKGIHFEVKKAEIFHGAYEPGCMTKHFGAT